MSLDTGKCIHAYHYEDDLTIPDSRIERVEESCRNMSGHTLMGRPAARLETMALAIRSYVLVYIVGKRR